VDLLGSGWGNATHCFNAACGYALAGQVDSAFVLLEMADSRGYPGVSSLREDSDLASLRGDARWPGLVAACSSNALALESMWRNPVWRSDYRDNIEMVEKIAGLSRLWTIAKYNFANFDLVPELDWDRTYFDHLELVLETESTLEYYEQLRAMCVQLKDGHSYVIPPDELRPHLWSRPLIRTRLVEGRVLVIATWGDTGAQKGIAVGDEILEIDGVSVERYATENVRPNQFASTPQDLDTKTYDKRLLAGPDGSSVSLALVRPDGEHYQCSLERYYGKERKRHITARPSAEMRIISDDIAYVALNTFMNQETADRFEEMFDDILEARALIIDIRENGGGNSGVGWRIMDLLADGRFDRSVWYTRQYVAADRARDRPEFRYEGASTGSGNAERHFSGPVIVLTSPRTYSAAEDFCVAFRGAKRGLLIGEPTGGSTGQPIFVKLPGGMSASVCSKRNLLTDGREFVGIGIQPDRLVVPTVDSVRNGGDPVLEAAVAELAR